MERKRILVDGEPMVLCQECVVNAEDENPLTSGKPMYGFRIGKYEDIMKDWANHSDNIGTPGENEGRIGLFHEVKDMKKEPIIISEYESNHKPVRLPC